MYKARQRTRAQAIVEFALAAMLIFFLLSAAIDLGLIFFRHQGLYNASLEGAQYGSLKTASVPGSQLAALSLADRQRLGCLVQTPNSTSYYTCLDEEQIRNRLINEAGAGGGINMVNMKDLDGNGKIDSTEPGFDYKKYIDIRAVASPTNRDAACPSIANPPPGVATCYVYVNVKSDYNMLFLLAPVFGDKVNVEAYTIMPVRTGLYQPGTPVGTIQLSSVTPSSTSTSTSTATASSTATSTTVAALPSATPKPATATRTHTPKPSNTAGPSPTRTRTKTAGPTKTATRTNTPGPSPTRTRTRTVTPTRTTGPTRTRTNTPKPAAPTRTATTEGT